MTKRTLDFEYEDLKLENKRIKTLYNMAVSRIDELHEVVHKMELRMEAMAKELKNVRNFSIDLLEDYGRTVGEIFDAKLRRDQENAARCAHELEEAFQEMVEWKDGEFEDSDYLWKLIIEEPERRDSFDTVDLTN